MPRPRRTVSARSAVLPREQVAPGRYVFWSKSPPARRTGEKVEQCLCLPRTSCTVSAGPDIQNRPACPVRNLRNWLLAGVFALVVAGSVAVASGNPWFQALFTAVVTALAIAISCRPGAMSPRRRIAASVAASVASLALYVAHASIERACTARDASGRSVVIGTELTPAGKKYLEANPHDNPDAILQSLGGLGPERAWTAASIARCRLQLEGTESLWLPLLGVALVCAVSLMQTSGAQRPVPTRAAAEECLHLLQSRGRRGCPPIAGRTRGERPPRVDRHRQHGAGRADSGLHRAIDPRRRMR